MDAEFKALIEDEYSVLRSIARNIVGDSFDDLMKYGSSAMILSIVSQGDLSADAPIAVEAKRKFALLCKSMPRINKDVLMALGLSFSSYEYAFGDGNKEEMTNAKVASTISAISMIIGFAVGILAGGKSLPEDQRKRLLSEIGISAAYAKLANDKDGKQSAKQQVRECWELWQQDLSRYKGPTAFARDMREKYDNLESEEVIRRWCRVWGIATQQA